MSNTSNIDQLTNLVNSLQNQIDQINSGNIAGTNIMSISQKLDNLNDLTIPSLKDNINNIQSTQNNLQQSHTNFQNRLDNNKNSLSDLQNQIQDTSTNHNTVANNLNYLNNQHNDLNNKQLNTINNTQNLHNSVNNLSNNHLSISNEIQNLKYQMQTFNTKLETITPTDSQHSQLMSKIDNLSNTLTPVMVRTQIAQQASNNLYAQLQPLQQTVNSQTAQIYANSSGILQNAAQAASNFGSFYGMGGDEPEGGGGSVEETKPPSGGGGDDDDGGGGGSAPDGGGGYDSSKDLDSPSNDDFNFRKAWYSNFPNLIGVGSSDYGMGATTMVSSQKGMKGFASKLTGPNNITDLSWLGIQVDTSHVKEKPSASPCSDLFKTNPLFTYSSSNSPPPNWIDYCTSVNDEAEKKAFHLIPLKGDGADAANFERVMEVMPTLRKFSGGSETYYAIDPYLFYAVMSTWGTGIDDKRLVQPTQKGLVRKIISNGPLGYFLPDKGGVIGPDGGVGNIGASSPAGTGIGSLVNQQFQSGKLGDFSDWDTSNVTTMRGMFFGSGLYSNFWGAKGLEWNTSKVTDMSGMFMLNSAWRPKTSKGNYGPNGGLKGQMSTYMSLGGNTEHHPELDKIMGAYDSFVADTSSYNEPSKGATTDLDLWNVNNVKDMSLMFFGTWWLDPPYDSSNPPNGLGGGMVLYQWNTSNVTDMSYLFANTGWGLSKGITAWNTTKVNNMEGLFFGNASIGYRNHSVQLDWDTSQVTNMSKMFSGGASKQLQAGQYIRSVRSGENNSYESSSSPSWGTSAGIKGFMMPAVNFLRDLSFGSKWKTDNVLEMNSMFAFATKLNAQTNADGSPGAPPNMGSMKGWIVTKVTSAYEMFLGSVIGDVSGTGVSNYTDDPTKKLDLSSWAFTTGADVRGFINPYSGMIFGKADKHYLRYGVGGTDKASSRFVSNGKFNDWNTFQWVNGYEAMRLQWDNYSKANANTPSSTYSKGIGKRCPKIGGDPYSLCGVCRFPGPGEPPYVVQKGQDNGMYRGGSVTLSIARSSVQADAYFKPGSFSGDYEYLGDAWQTYWDNNDIGGGTALIQNDFNGVGVNLRAGVDRKGINLCPQRGPLVVPNDTAILSSS